MHKKSAIFFSIFFLCLSVVSPSAFCDEINNSETVCLSLGEAIDIAFANNRDIQIQKRALEVATASIIGARSAFLPIVNIDGSYTYNEVVLHSILTNPKKDPGTFSGYQNDNLLGASATTTLYKGGYNMANYKQAELSLKTEKEKLRSMELEVEFETKRLYYGLLLAYETERIKRNLLEQAEAHYEDARNKFGQGTVSKFDVLQSKVHVSTSIPGLVKATTDIDLIKAELNNLLSFDVHDPIEPKGKLSYLSFMEVDEGSFLDEAYMGNPEMVLRSLGIDIQRYSITKARAGNLPTVVASAGGSYRSNDVGDMLNKRHGNWNAGISVTIPIFDGFSAMAKVEEAKARYAEAALQQIDTTEQIAVDIRRACLDLIQSKAIIESQEDNIDEAKEALRLSIVGYDAGVNTNLDVLDAQVALSEVEENLAEGIYDYLMAEALLDKTMGREYLREDR